MNEKRQAERRLLEILHELDFARRWYAFSATGRSGLPQYGLTNEQLCAAVEETGRAFRYRRQERFYTLREKDVPGQIGLNLVLRLFVAEFILVVQTCRGHVGGPFSLLMREVECSFGPGLLPMPIYPNRTFRDAAELRTVLTEGFVLYDQAADAVRASGLSGKIP